MTLKKIGLETVAATSAAAAWLFVVLLIIGLFGLKLGWVQRGSVGGIMAIIAITCSLLGTVAGGFLAAKYKRIKWMLTSLVSFLAGVLLFFVLVGFSLGSMH